jgi:hypothetical protein
MAEYTKIDADTFKNEVGYEFKLSELRWQLAMANVANANYPEAMVVYGTIPEELRKNIIMLPLIQTKFLEETIAKLEVL